jgi:hypothetical protein
LIATTPRWAWITAGVTALALVAAGIALSKGNGGSAADQDSTYGQHPEDVKITSCAEHGGYAQASLRVANNSSSEANYALQISFMAPNGTAVYDSRTLVVDQLPAHQTSGVQQVRSSKPVGKQLVTCVVARAARYGT